jgi:mannose-1-phosphate guanylyltransferase / phosphomannomutase
MKVFIVAGGLAARMGALTEEIPKCLIDVNGKPLIRHQLEFFGRHGFRDIVFCVAHLAGKVRDAFGDGEALGLSIAYAQEGEGLLGTAGSVKHAEGLIGGDEDFIVFYGDNLTSMDFERLVAFHLRKKAEVTIVMRPLPPGYRSSSLITLGGDSGVKTLIEGPSEGDFERHGGGGYINSGIYVLNRSVLGLMPPGRKYDFNRDVFPAMLKDGRRLFGYPTEEFFREIGRPEKYRALLEEFKGRGDIL